MTQREWELYRLPELVNERRRYLERFGPPPPANRPAGLVRSSEELAAEEHLGRIHEAFGVTDLYPPTPEWYADYRDYEENVLIPDIPRVWHEAKNEARNQANEEAWFGLPRVFQ